MLTSLSSTRWLRGSPSSTTKKPSLFTWERSPVQKGYDLPDRMWGHTEGLGGSVHPHASMQPVPSTGTGQCCACLLVRNSGQALTLLGWQSQTLIEVQHPTGPLSTDTSEARGLSGRDRQRFTRFLQHAFKSPGCWRRSAQKCLPAGQSGLHNYGNRKTGQVWGKWIFIQPIKQYEALQFSAHLLILLPSLNRVSPQKQVR